MWLLLTLWGLLATLIGAPFAVVVLRRETRLQVLLLFSLLLGNCLQTLGLLALWRLLPLGEALYVVMAVSAIVGFCLARRISWNRAREQAWGLSSDDFAPLAITTAAFAFLAYRVFTVAFTALDPEAMFWRAGVTSWMTRGLYPPTNPLEVSDLLRYRFGFNLLAAALSAASEETAPVAVAGTIAFLLALMPLSLSGASCRLFGSPKPGLLASGLGLMGGSVLWCLTGPAAALQLVTPVRAAKDFLTGLLWAGTTLYEVKLNASVAVGFAAFSVVLWLVWEAAEARRRTPSLSVDVVTVAALVYLGIFEEVYFVALVAALAILCTLRCAGLWRDSDAIRGRQHLGREGAVLLVSLVVVLMQGGVLGGMAPAGQVDRSAGLVVNVAHAGSVVIPVAKPLEGWFPVLSPEATLDTDLILIGLPVLILIAWKYRDSFAALGLIACAVCLAAWVAVYPKMYPASAYHFGQNAIVGYLAIAPLAIASMNPQSRLMPSRARRAGFVLLYLLLVAPGIVYGTVLTIGSFPAAFGTPSSPNFAAAQFLRHSQSTSRVLVPLPVEDDQWEQIYLDSAPAEAIREMLALSEHSVPVGFSPDFLYSVGTGALYRRAGNTFDVESLSALGIDWVYALPYYMTDRQRNSFQAAETQGRLRFAARFGDEGQPTERLLYRVALGS